MNAAEFDALVAKLEPIAQRDPAGYRNRVLLLALLGNAYIAAIVVGLVLAIVGLALLLAKLRFVAVKLIAVLAPLLWMILKSVWIRLDPPEGIPLSRGDAPELFAVIDELRRQLGAPRFHRVLLTDDFNAGVVQSPRLGVFGWYQNYLLIGLPLMKSLDAEQFKAVLAHEFGHLAGGHGRLSNWVYRQRLRWSRLMQTLTAADTRGVALFKRFCDWYVPYFNAYSFPLARANEYEADAASVRLTSRDAAAGALTGTGVIGQYLEERFWPGVHRAAEEQPQPAFAPYAGLAGRLADDLGDAATRTWLQRALARTTSSADTHPALTDRLRAIGAEARFAPPATGTAADRLLGASLQRLTTDLDRRWHERVLPYWQSRHQEVQEGRQRLADLDRRHVAGETLTPQERYDRAVLADEIGRDVATAIERLRELHAALPDDATVCVALGARQLAQGNDAAAAIALLERAMALDDQATGAVCEAIRDHHWRHGDEDAAHAWHERLLQRVAEERGAEAERSTLRRDDKLEPHGLDAATIARLREQLVAAGGLRRVYLVRKRTSFLAERPFYVCAFRIAGLFRFRSARKVQEAVQRIQQMDFPGETLIINVEGDNASFHRMFRRVPDCRII